MEIAEPISVENLLARASELIDWRALEPEIKALAARAGRPLPLSAVKIALLKQWYELAESSAEFTILDRLSFRAFLGFRGDGGAADVEVMNELRESSWSGLRELRPILDLIDAQLRSRGYAVQPGYIIEAAIAPNTDSDLREPGAAATALPSPGELGRMVEAVTAKAHAQGRMPTGPQSVPDAASEAAGLASVQRGAAEEDERVVTRIRAQIEWPWGQRSDLTDVLPVGRDYAFSPFARELTPYTHVSRRHAELLVHGDAVWIRDLGSRNGTFVNNEEVPRGQAFLIDSDSIVRFGPLLAVSLKLLD